MYLPSRYAESRTEAMHALMHAHPLAHLVTLGTDGLESNPLPFELDDRDGEFGVLRAHAARANPFWRSASRSQDALVIFQGPDAYISPQWYPSKQVDGRAVPTWNYLTVHAYGPLRIVDDRIWLRALLDRLTRTHERHQPVPWRLDEAPADYLEQLLGLVIGIEIPIRRLQGKWKNSQNQPRVNQLGVMSGLQQQANPDANALAHVIQQHLNETG